MMPLSAVPDIKTALQKQNAVLLGALRSLRWRYLWMFSLASLAVVIAVTAGLILFYPHPGAIWLPATLLSLACSVMLLKGFDTVYHRKVDEAVRRGLTTGTGLRFLPQGAKPVSAFKLHNILPAGGETTVDSGYAGWHRETTVALQNVTSRHGLHRDHLLIVMIQFLKPLSGHTVIATANATQGILANRFDSFGVIGIGDPNYNRQLDVRATDRAEGRMLVDAALIDAFAKAGLRLKSRWAAASFREMEAVFVFDDGAMQAALPGLVHAVTPDAIRRVTARIEIMLAFADIMAANHRIHVL